MAVILALTVSSARSMTPEISLGSLVMAGQKYCVQVWAITSSNGWQSVHCSHARTRSLSLTHIYIYTCDTNSFFSLSLSVSHTHVHPVVLVTRVVSKTLFAKFDSLLDRRLSQKLNALFDENTDFWAQNSQVVWNPIMLVETHSEPRATLCSCSFSLSFPHLAWELLTERSHRSRQVLTGWLIVVGVQTRSSDNINLPKGRRSLGSSTHPTSPRLRPPNWSSCLFDQRL